MCAQPVGTILAIMYGIFPLCSAPWRVMRGADSSIRGWRLPPNMRRILMGCAQLVVFECWCPGRIMFWLNEQLSVIEVI